MVKVKICGITSLEDALDAIDCGADAIGFVFAASPRQVSVAGVRRITAELPPFVCRVGVFVDEAIDLVAKTVRECRLDVVQLHGNESPEYCAQLATRVVKAFKVRGGAVPEGLQRYRVSAFLLDTFDRNLQGGTGRAFDWNVAREAGAYGRVILSGGLGPGNVADAVRKAHPYAVDVSSGVEESPGRKDKRKMAAFVQAAKAA